MLSRVQNIVILVFISSLCANSNPDSLKIKHPFSVGISVNRGFILNHKKGKLVGSEINNSLILTHFTSVQAMFEWQTTGNKNWHKWFNYPTYGLSLTYFNIDDSRIGNHGLSAMAHHNLSCISSTFYKLKFGIGVGIGYFSTIYHPIENPINQYVSTHISAAVQVAFENSFLIHNKLKLTVTPTFNHFSNGASVLPNFGLNMFGIALGLKYKINDFDTKHEPKKPDIFASKKNFLHFYIAYGSNILAIPNYNYFYNYTIDLSYGRKLGKISKLIIGTNIMHSNIDNNPTANNVAVINRPFLAIDRSSIWVAHEFLINRIGLITGFGIYTFKPSGLSSIFYSRLGLRYHFHKNMFGAVILRSHSNVADTIEWALGFTL